MSADQVSSRSSPRQSSTAKLVRYDEYIDTQIKNTRRTVKAVDLATLLVLLLTGVLAFLLAAAIADHWLVPGGLSVAMRAMLLTVLVCGVAYFALRRILPLCVRAINPVYAAHTIEHGSPSLKNSLVNLLLFRQRRSEISDAVYETLEEQAAHRLTRVAVDAAVDRSLLIRGGYILLAVAAVAALYKVLSPKDPLVAAERVLMPWAKIVPASRVTITEIEPGSATVSRGEFIDVSAEIRGLDESDAVRVCYTTSDGQAVDRPIDMKLAQGGLRYQARMPDDTESEGSVGAVQNLTYHIEAGDARSLDYQVIVVPAPAILVERVEYDYPQYTGFVDRTVEDIGDIRAIEGTRVTLHARANGLIDAAEVDFDADGRRDLRMSSDGSYARAAFDLALREDRQTPRHASYVLRFSNREGRANRNPVKHSIDVEPDYAPEAAILQPREKSLDVRLDETVAIEIEARDPDFALSDVRLKGEVAGREVLDERLLAISHSGRFTARYQFTPNRHNLRAGDVVQYWVAANDNRTPTPNGAASERKLFRIISADPADQPPPDRIAQRDQRRQQPGEGQPQDAQGDQQQDGQQGNADNQDGQQQGEDASNGKSDSADGKPGESASADGNNAQGAENQPGSNSGERSQPDQSTDTRQGDSSNEGENNQSNQRDAQPGQQPKPGQSGSNSDQQNQNEKQTGAGAAGGDSSQQGSQPDGTRPDQNTSGKPGNNSQQGDPQQPGDDQSPVSSDGDNDAEAFKRIERHLARRGELKEGESPMSGENAGEEGETSDSRDESQPSGSKAKPGAENQSARPEEGNAERDRPSSGDNTNPESGAENDAAQSDDSAQDRRDAPTQSNQSDERGQSNPDRAEGTGAETRGDDLEQPKQQPGIEGEQNKSQGGEQTASKGPSGAGNEQKTQGSPDSPQMKPVDKRQQSPSANEKTNDQEPPAGLEKRDKRESDSQGAEGGDRSGGGEEGGGQKAPREGTGSSGQNQSADDGAGQSQDKGPGADSTNPGRDATSQTKTGESSGETPGRGRKQQQPAGTERGNESGADDPTRPKNSADSPPDSREPQPFDREARKTEDGKSNSPGENNADQQGGSSTGDGGNIGTNAGRPASIDGEAPPGDAANLEYAHKQTDLVLEKLADQLKRKKVDERLLENLGWSEQDLQRFINRWQQRKDVAKRNDAARRELDDALRSLGLRRGPLQQSTTRDDTMRDLRDGYRGPVPLEYQEQLRAYNQGISRARADDE